MALRPVHQPLIALWLLLGEFLVFGDSNDDPSALIWLVSVQKLENSVPIFFTLSKIG